MLKVSRKNIYCELLCLLSRSKINLRYATIIAPISGVVVSRAVVYRDHRCSKSRPEIVARDDGKHYGDEYGSRWVIPSSRVGCAQG